MPCARIRASSRSTPGSVSRRCPRRGGRRRRSWRDRSRIRRTIDDAHLRSLGIKPELRRTLGFLSNFAIAFSFISVSTGTYGNFGVGLSQAGPAFFWSWPIVIIGQLIVALVFAELASHFPVAGSIYQWSKRLSNRTLGWFTGWFYFWAQVVTVTAVAVIVAYVIDGIHGPATDQVAFLDSPDPTGLTTMFTFISLVDARHHDADQRLRRAAAVAPQQHRRRRPRSSGCSCSR